MKQNILKIIGSTTAMIFWNVMFNFFISHIHGKYDTVQMDTGQIASVYKSIMEYLNCTSLVVNIAFVILISYFIYKTIKDKEVK